MLTDLTIRNIAIIDSLHISLQPGLTVLTGETGAGKSIIIDAVGLIMGGRASSDLIRSGEEEAQVEALFDLSGNPDISATVNEAGIDCTGELLIRRTISRSGKNRIFINGSLATATILSDIAPRLINIYGQHDSQTLLRQDNHLRLLDSYAGLLPLRQQFAALFEQLRHSSLRLEQLEQQERDAERRLDLLSFQLEEISAAGLTSGEDTELEERRRILAGAEKLGTASGEAFEQLYSCDGSLLGHLRRISQRIDEAASIDPALSHLAEALESAYVQIEDTAMSLRNYATHLDIDPSALQHIEDRIDLLNRLKRKYGVTIDEIISFGQTAADEIAQLKSISHDRTALSTELSALREQLQQTGSELSRSRREAAPKLAHALAAEARQLAMKGAVIEAALETGPEPRPNGMERLELLFSPNPGETPRPLAKIASGGELSRLMLAFKQVLPERDVPTLIFDEVDTGISGATSEVVGNKLKKVAAGQQVFCITHLPQVAACADHHLKVEKLQRGDRTITAVTVLAQNERIDEVARLFAGETITDSARRHAEELIAASSRA